MSRLQFISITLFAFTWTCSDAIGCNADTLPLYATKGKEICMKELGCFTFTDDFYHPIYRPYNFLPNERSVINTRFHLFTRSNPMEHVDLRAHDELNIRHSPINSSYPTKFIIHGFIDNRLYGKWMDTLKDHLLLRGEMNVILVDWSGGNLPPYSQAAVNTRIVGAEIALMIKTLQKTKGISSMDCHIIGHSLGAHAAGYAGKLLNKLGRISAVDPAEPLFQYMPATVRVDRTDADFVDVIHTDTQTILMLGLGMSQAVGHVDFYPNDGKHQPGCKTDVIRSIFLEGLLDATRRFIACNHQRAVDFFTFSINHHQASPVAYECPSWKDYQSGHCADCGKDNTRCALMGLRADEYRPMKNDSVSRKFYISTAGASPYWVYHYQVLLKLSRPKKAFIDQKGLLNLELHGELGFVNVKLTDDSIDLYHGATYKFLVKTEKRIGKIQSVTFTWESNSWSIFKKKAIHLDFVKIVPMNIIDKQMRKNQEQKFCAKKETAIKPNSLISLSTLCN